MKFNWNINSSATDLLDKNPTFVPQSILKTELTVLNEKMAEISKKRTKFYSKEVI